MRLIWVEPLAILTFWGPASRGGPDFNAVHLLTNSTGLAFFMMTPVYVGLLSLYWPKVNMVVLRVTSLVGLIIGLYNIPYQFIVSPTKFYWGGILHIPLILISLYGLIILFRCPRAEQQNNSDMNCP